MLHRILDKLPTADAYARIWDAVCSVPRGRVVSYGQAAQLAGLPGHARLIGRALGAAPKERGVPWHRVIDAQGRIALPAQSKAFREQRRLLMAEGVEVTRGRIDMARFGWVRDPSPLLD